MAKNRKGKPGSYPGKTNKHGLSRYIKEDIARRIRVECAFGCVICGGSIVDYEHIDPPFSEARVHDPAAIAMLCPTCHGKVTRGYLSKETVKKARLNPHCRQTGFSWGGFDITELGAVKLGTCTFLNCRDLLTVDGDPVLRIEGGEVPGAPIRFSGRFTGPTGVPLLWIRNNVWKASSRSWDVKFSGGTIEIRDDTEGVILLMRAEPPTGVAVEKLRMTYKSFRLVVEDGVVDCNIGNWMYTDFAGIGITWSSVAGGSFGGSR